MTRELEIFWEEVKKIQDYVVNVSLAKISQYGNMENLLNDVTYETIYGIMELLDGHKNSDIWGKVIDKHTGSSINTNIELHNYCEEYLNCSDI